MSRKGSLFGWFVLDKRNSLFVWVALAVGFVLLAGLLARSGDQWPSTSRVVPVSQVLEPTRNTTDAERAPGGTTSNDALPDPAVGADKHEDDINSPAFDLVRIDRSGSVVAAGTGPADSEVGILADGELLAWVTTDSQGTWATAFDATLAPGTHEMQLVASLADGSKRESAGSVIVTVPKRSGQGVLVFKPSDSQGPTLVLQGSKGGSLSIQTLDYAEDGSMTIGGIGPARSRLLVYLDGSFSGESEVDGDGRWRFLLPAVSDASGKALRVDHVDVEGEVLERAEVHVESRQSVAVAFADSTTHKKADSIGEAWVDEATTLVQEGNSLWRIARREYGDGTLYTVIFAANQQNIRSPDLIYPGQELILPHASE